MKCCWPCDTVMNILLAGYRGIYKQRTGHNTDGVAIYYKTDVFQLADHTTVEYFQPGIDILDRHNVGLIAKLAIKANPTKHLVIATTHLLFNRNRHDVKLAQTMILLAEVERFAYESCRYVLSDPARVSPSNHSQTLNQKSY